MYFTDTNVSVCVCVRVYVFERGGSVSERERELEINQTSTRLRETQPSYRPVARKSKHGAESAVETGSGSALPDYDNIVYSPQTALFYI